MKCSCHGLHNLDTSLIIINIFANFITTWNIILNTVSCDQAAVGYLSQQYLMFTSITCKNALYPWLTPTPLDPSSSCLIHPSSRPLSSSSSSSLAFTFDISLLELYRVILQLPRSIVSPAQRKETTGKLASRWTG